MELLPAGAGRRQVIGCLPASFAFFPSVWQAPGKHLANARFVCYKKPASQKLPRTETILLHPTSSRIPGRIWESCERWRTMSNST